jgi:hypothetical protein
VYVVANSGQFGQLNLSTGAYTLIGNPPSNVVGGLGFGPGGQLYGFGLDNNLYKLDSVGNGTLVGPATGLSHGGGWGFGGASDGTLYAQGAGVMYTLDPTTGAPTVLGNEGFDSGSCPVTDASGNLFLDQNGSGELYSINKTTGAGTAIGHMATASTVDAMAWAGGAMYAIDFAGDIYRVNTSTAAVTLVATSNPGVSGEIVGAASNFQAVPEPVSMLALGAGALALLRRRR